jgi:hypothetical protein
MVYCKLKDGGLKINKKKIQQVIFKKMPVDYYHLRTPLNPAGRSL